MLNLQHSCRSPSSSTFYASDRNSSNAKKKETENRERKKSLRLASPRLFGIHFVICQRELRVWKFLCVLVWPWSPQIQAEAAAAAVAAVAAATDTERDRAHRVCEKKLFTTWKRRILYIFLFFSEFLIFGLAYYVLSSASRYSGAQKQHNA